MSNRARDELGSTSSARGTLAVAKRSSYERASAAPFPPRVSAHSIVEIALIEIADRRISPLYYPSKCSES